jgi:uncharacterized protein DUF3311
VTPLTEKPSALSVLLGLVPFFGVCFSVALWDRVYPMILGLPFNLAWLLCWVVLSALCVAGAYRIEAARADMDTRRQ